MKTPRRLVQAAWLIVATQALAAGCFPTPMPPPIAAVDQQQPTIDTAVGGSSIGGASQQILAQVVVAGRAGRLLEVQFPVACSSGNLIVEIRQVSAADEPVGVALTSETVAGSTLPSFVPNPPTFRAIRFSVPVPVSVGTRFAIVLLSAGQCATFQGPVGDPYTGGHAWFDARPNPAHQWVRMNTGGGRDDLPFQTVVGP